jgi:hypothetical protein
MGHVSYEIHSTRFFPFFFLIYATERSTLLNSEMPRVKKLDTAADKRNCH